MNLEFFRTFISLSNTGSFTKTALEEFVSQSTVSTRIKEMEVYFGIELFKRKSGKAVLTKEGKLLLPYVERILSIEQAAETILQNSKQHNEVAKIATVHSFYDNYLMQQLWSFNSPDSRSLNITINHSREVINSMVSGKNSIGFSHHPCNYSDFSSKFLFKEKLMLVTSNNTQIVDQGITLSDLRNLNFINTNFIDSHVEELILGKIMSVITINIGPKALDLVRKGRFISLFPENYVKSDIDNGLLFQIPIHDYDFPPVEYYCIYPKRNNSLTEFEKEILNSFLLKGN
ncbi:MAG: LysR family transcriptional regulator [Tissierellia bacterium]|nr:LysR family transcriptional regulator [Tissierellia bacterium]